MDSNKKPKFPDLKLNVTKLRELTPVAAAEVVGGLVRCGGTDTHTHTTN
jgi:hypothetical protein